MFNDWFVDFSRLADGSPDAPAVIDSENGRIVSRSDLVRRANELAVELAAAHIPPQALVGIKLPNCADFVASLLAIARHDAVAVFIDRDATDAEVGTILSHFGVSGLIYRNGGTRITTRSATLPQLPENARVIKLTSGSTGQPKGIVASEENLHADSAQICATMGITPTDINFGAIPLSHSYGFSNLVMPLLAQGTPVVISNDYIPHSIIERCNRFKCTVFPGIPMAFEHLASTPREDGQFHTVRTFISAGAPLTPGTSRRFRERFGHSIHTFYGCSECGGITYDREGGAVERGDVGAAMQGVTLQTKSSSLLISSPALSLGYLHDAGSFEPFESRRFVADDLVKIAGDGAVTITGRASDLINTAGKKVNPREVEQVILQIEGVRQVKVYGEAAGARGEVVAAAVVASPDVTRDDIRAFCREHLSPHKVPRIVKLIEQIPLDERGKVRRSALAAL